MHPGTNAPTVIHRNDGNDYYIMLSAWLKCQSGWTSARPFTIAFASGDVSTSGNFICSKDVTLLDAKLKTNLEVIPDALSKVQKLTGYTYERTDLGEDGKRHAGLIAQGLKRFCPK